jgi:hypothetical protein
LYVPAGSAFTTQLNKVCVKDEPASGPVLLRQALAAPVKVQFTVPAGAFAPVIPVTVAVNVIVPPNAGLAGELVMVIVGVATVTVRDCAADVGNDE